MACDAFCPIGARRMHPVGDRTGKAPFSSYSPNYNGEYHTIGVVMAAGEVEAALACSGRGDRPLLALRMKVRSSFRPPDCATSSEGRLCPLLKVILTDNSPKFQLVAK